MDGGLWSLISIDSVFRAVLVLVPKLFRLNVSKNRCFLQRCVFSQCVQHYEPLVIHGLVLSRNGMPSKQELVCRVSKKSHTD